MNASSTTMFGSASRRKVAQRCKHRITCVVVYRENSAAEANLQVSNAASLHTSTTLPAGFQHNNPLARLESISLLGVKLL